MTEDIDTARHHDKMAKKKAARDKIMAGKTIERGLLIVHTGKGKGKSTAAFGMVFRHIGHGLRAGVIQFVKGAWGTGERTVLEKFPELVTIKAMGEGFTWETQDITRDIAHARAGWEEAKRMIADPSYKMVMLDELNIVLRYDYLPLAEVLEVLKNRPADKHIVVTGRNAKEELIEIADLVTEMELIKHPFRSGVKAQAGIEF
ncbi:MAG TPA: cob(I)yrinic acid a,c-diamide adenosyltransferase [Aestuariivirga sp.]|nr:cob(I)yrinic acid a,c-diamide adenosyltransferase [Hyphomicrobiales bacterium]MBP9174224.1 cob(I)yrinic acid a,c-diamide adenosyltransferase [Hyphomicrobiales bacterium]HQY73437.1 cob(I)yrinic acid a,c-diamide adenosyltransferase [Aestuariivirga sp.]